MSEIFIHKKINAVSSISVTDIPRNMGGGGGFYLAYKPIK
jgi:hypothetical protein